MGDLNTALRSLYQSDNVDSEQLFETGKERATSGIRKKLCTYNIRVLGKWTKLCDGTMSAGNIKKFK